MCLCPDGPKPSQGLTLLRLCEIMSFITLMKEGRVVDLDDTLASSAAGPSRELKLPLANRFILANAQAYNTTFWIQDPRFKNIEWVKYTEKTT